MMLLHKLLDPSYSMHLPRGKMASNLQTTFLNAFSWMNNFVFLYEFHLSLGLIENKSASI